jgi:Arc/MetJ-type ribon-helix-helix transcriptional regulator
MTETEKITINISPVDLGKIDLLVEQGFYSNRTDFIRAAIRRQLNEHSDVVQETIKRRAFSLGILVYDRAELEQRRAESKRLSIYAVGMLVIADDVPPELARETIEHVEVYGVFRASPAVREALKDRIV